jgi:hypothetical protein
VQVAKNKLLPIESAKSWIWNSCGMQISAFAAVFVEGEKGRGRSEEQGSDRRADRTVGSGAKNGSGIESDRSIAGGEITEETQKYSFRSPLKKHKSFFSWEGITKGAKSDGRIAIGRRTFKRGEKVALDPDRGPSHQSPPATSAVPRFINRPDFQLRAFCLLAFSDGSKNHHRC